MFHRQRLARTIFVTRRRPPLAHAIAITSAQPSQDYQIPAAADEVGGRRRAAWHLGSSRLATEWTGWLAICAHPPRWRTWLRRS